MRKVLHALVLLLLPLSTACDDGDDARRVSDAGFERDAGEELEQVRPRRKLAVSAAHSCALRETGLYCWGENYQGQLGTGDQTSSEVPVLSTVDTEGVVDLAACGARTCVLKQSGEVACWGLNDHGQLGDGTREDSLEPRLAAGIDDAVALALAEESSCALHEGGTVSCWGESPSGAPEGGSLSPRRVAKLSRVIELRASVFSTFCARNERSEVFCWRHADGGWSEPAPVMALAGARALAVPGHDEVCAIVPSGEIRCHNLDSKQTAPLSDSKGALELVATGLVTCASNASGAWHCWNVLPPMLHSSGSPAIPVPSDVRIAELAVGGFNFCGLREDHEVVCASATGIDVSPTPTIVEQLPR